MNKTIEQLGMYFFDLQTAGGTIRAIYSRDIPKIGYNSIEQELFNNGIFVLIEEE